MSEFPSKPYFRFMSGQVALKKAAGPKALNRSLGLVRAGRQMGWAQRCASAPTGGSAAVRASGKERGQKLQYVGHQLWACPARSELRTKRIGVAKFFYAMSLHEPLNLPLCDDGSRFQHGQPRLGVVPRCRLRFRAHGGNGQRRGMQEMHPLKDLRRGLPADVGGLLQQHTASLQPQMSCACHLCIHTLHVVEQQTGLQVV